MILLALSLLVCTNSVSNDFRTAASVRTNFRWMLLGVTVGLSVSAVCCLSIIDQSLLTGMVDRPAGLTDIIGAPFKLGYVEPSVRSVQELFVLSVEELSARSVEADSSRFLAHHLMLGRLSTVSRTFRSNLSEGINTESTERAKKGLYPLMYDISSTVHKFYALLELASNYDALILHLGDLEHAISQAITNSASDICEGLRFHKESLRRLLHQLKDNVQLTQLSLELRLSAAYRIEFERLIELMKSFKFSKPAALHNALIDFQSNRTVGADRTQLADSLKVTDQKFDRACWVRFIPFLHAIQYYYKLWGRACGDHFHRFVALDAFSRRVNTSSQLHDLIGPIALRCARDPNSSFGFKLYFEEIFDEPNVTMFVDPDSLRSLIRRSFIDFKHIDSLQLANRWMRYFDYHRVLDPRAISLIKQYSSTGYLWGLDETERAYDVLVEPSNLPLLENRAVICEELRRFVFNLIALYSTTKCLRADGSADHDNYELRQVLTEPVRNILIKHNRTNRNSSLEARTRRWIYSLLTCFRNLICCRFYRRSRPL